MLGSVRNHWPAGAGPCVLAQPRFYFDTQNPPSRTRTSAHDSGNIQMNRKSRINRTMWQELMRGSDRKIMVENGANRNKYQDFREVL